MGNMTLLCPYHHRLVHEGGWRIEGDPNGELILGLKIEDKYALEHVDESLSVPGIAFAEWGPGDMALSFGMPEGSSRNRSYLQCRRAV